jgi:ParB/RepB/Spo0J family partition protein
MPEFLTEESCASEIRSFKRYGQRIPVLGRPAPRKDAVDVELIYGARRLFVATLLGVPLKVDLRDLTDKEALIEMDIENRQRRDVSPYERGMSYRAWLAEGFFSSQQELCNAFGISPARLSRLLKFAELPAVVTGAFACPTELKEKWAVHLVDFLNDSDSRRWLLEGARRLGSNEQRDSAEKVYKYLVSCGKGERQRLSRRSRTDIIHLEGDHRFVIRWKHQQAYLILPSSWLTSGIINELKNLFGRAASSGSFKRKGSRQSDSVASGKAVADRKTRAAMRTNGGAGNTIST